MPKSREKKLKNVKTDDVKKLIVSAVRKGDLAGVKEIVELYGLSCFEDGNRGHLLILDAIKLPRLDIAMYLLQKGVKVEHETDGTDTLLHLAIIERRSVELVRLLLKKKASIEARNAQNETPLHLAAKNGYSKIVKILLDNNASVTAQTAEGATPLLLAAEGSHEEVCNMLLEHASANLGTSARNPDFLNRVLLCNPSIRDRVDKLVVSVITDHGGNYKIVDELIDHGFIPSRGYVNKALLSAAVGKNYVKLVRNILMSDSIPDNVKSDPLFLHHAVKEGLKEMVELLINSGFYNVKNQVGKRCLQIIANKMCDCGSNHWKDDRCVEILRLLLAHGADIEETPDLLHTAVKNGLVEVCKLLIDNGVDLDPLNEFGETPLYVSCGFVRGCAFVYDERERQKQDEIVQLLLDRGADANFIREKNGFTAFHQAVYCDRKEVVSIFINRGIDVDSRYDDSNTLLHQAVLRGHKQIIEVLCENNASVGASNKFGETPLHTAISAESADFAKMLLKFGADINARISGPASCSSYGMTPLHKAAYSDRADVARVLLSSGADVNAPVVVGHNIGRTPLHLAAVKNNASVVKTLLKFGCDVDACGPNNETALHFAFLGDCSDWNAKFVTLLLDKAFDVNAETLDGNTVFDCAISTVKAHFKNIHCPYLYNILESDSLEAIETLKRHLIKLKAAGFYVRDIKQELRQLDYSKPSHSQFRAKCEEELNKLKSVKVKLQFTLFDILMNSTNPFFIRNKSQLMQTLDSFNFKRYPVYGSLIKGNLGKSKGRYDLIHSGQYWLTILIKTSNRLNELECPVLPVELSEWIVSYLNNPELKTLIACGEALKRQVNTK